MSWDAIHGTLTSVKKNNTVIRYGYTSDGQRLTKEVAGKKTTYVYNAGMLLSEVTDTDRINYYYDSDGIISQVGYQKKNGSSFGTESFYFFTRNGQGNVVGVYEGNKSTLVGTYEYDLWGKVAAVTKAGSTSDPENFLNRNPIRYRSYYYDNETGFYYLNARYYDPIVHRFISADIRIAGVSKDVTGYNLYEYCNNNPVMFVDYTGYWPSKDYGITAGVGLNFSVVVWFWSIDVTPSLVIDGKGNIAGFLTAAWGTTVSDCLALSIGPTISFSDAPTIDYLRNEGTSFGGSAIMVPGTGAGIYAGIDINHLGNIDNKLGEGYTGISLSGGPTIATLLGGEVHSQISYTWMSKPTNVFDKIKKSYNRLTDEIKKYFRR